MVEVDAVRWVINIPVWGEDYRRRWIERGYPAICAALKHAGFPQHRWVVHTDRPQQFLQLFANDTVDYTDRPHEISASAELGTADRRGFAQTHVGETIMFLNADMVPSVEVFARCEEIFRAGRKVLVSCPSIRTIDAKPPIGNGAELADWALAFSHQFTIDCIWTKGRCKLPPYMIFQKADRPDNVVMHAFDLHPLAIFKTHDYQLRSPTASEFISEFDFRQVYIVRHPEMIIAEPCGNLEYARFRKRAYDKNDVVDWARHIFSGRTQQLQFRQQIVLRGLIDPQAQAVANDVYARLQKPQRWKFVMPSTLSARIAIGMAVPAPIRRLIPKSVREAIKNFEVREIGWPRP